MILLATKASYVETKQNKTNTSTLGASMTTLKSIEAIEVCIMYAWHSHSLSRYRSPTVSCESVMSPVASSDGMFAFIPPGYNGKIPSCNKPVGN